MQTQASLFPSRSDATRHFFDSKADYLAYLAAWRRLDGIAANGAPRHGGHFAAHALLTGVDLFRAFAPNRRGHGQAPYGALRAALRRLALPEGFAKTEAGVRAMARLRSRLVEAQLDARIAAAQPAMEASHG